MVFDGLLNGGFHRRQKPGRHRYALRTHSESRRKLAAGCGRAARNHRHFKDCSRLVVLPRSKYPSPSACIQQKVSDSSQ
jgi:hypothetical protein